MNNWETLDIHHYLTFSDVGRRDLDGACIPIHDRGSELVELSELNILIDPRFRGARQTITAIDTALAIVYRGHLDHLWPRRRNVRTRTCDRLFESLRYFLRSFQGGGRSWSTTVSLSTAFEMLLTDSHTEGVGGRLARRLRLVLRGVPGTLIFQRALADVYEARGDLVHAGTEPSGVDLSTARRAFVLAFSILAPRIPTLPNGTQSPMLVLTGDTPTPAR